MRRGEVVARPISPMPVTGTTTSAPGGATSTGHGRPVMLMSPETASSTVVEQTAAASSARAA